MDVLATVETVISVVDSATPIAEYAGSALSSVVVTSSAIPLGNEQLIALVQQFDVGERIVLFMIDATMIKALDGTPGEIYRFTPMQFSGFPITWRGDIYEPLACIADGFETSGQSAPATPKIRVSNVGNLFGAAAITLGDLVGAICYRYRTFKKFLDGQPGANGDAFYTPDVYTIQRKSTQNKQFIEWELSAGIDQENVFVPGRVVLKYTCTATYRVWDPTLAGGAGDFSYVKVTCPFNGSQNGNKFFNELDAQVTDPTLDSCSHADNGCALRFPGQDLQTWAFPGVGATT